MAWDMGIEPGELTRGGVGDDSGALDPPPCRRVVVEALNHPVDQLADFPVEPPVVAEEDTSTLGNMKTIWR